MLDSFHPDAANDYNPYRSGRTGLIGPITGPYRLVPEGGLEPPRVDTRRILSPLRLPFRHSGMALHRFTSSP